ncbi:hypothetical protein FLONG3_11126 [Fusarium longipes]|uniref:Apple domain-containing protein n=1 Tax=Fusarium longipes TaxID=694270 RepID=A0A395RHU2_9HYPO|nr:hypothetical protein FLONG3_11126 [Fusarium longipes]
MSRYLRSFLLITVLGAPVNAGPCRPHQISASSHTDDVTQTISSSTAVASLLEPSDTWLSYTSSEDTSTGREESFSLPTDSTSFSDIYSSSAVTIRDTTISSMSSGISLDITTTLSNTEFPVTTSTDTKTIAVDTETSATTSETGSTTDSSETITEATSTDTTAILKETDTFTITAESSQTTDTTIADTTTMTSAATTTTALAEPEPACKNNMVNPPLEYRICGRMGDSGGLYYEGEGPQGSTQSLLACAKACSEGSCRGFKFEVDKQCTFYVGTSLLPDDTTTTFKWYQPECFCDLDKVEMSEPEPTCKDNLVNPLPQYRVCGAMGDNTGLYDGGPGPAGSSKSLQACAKACSVDACSAFRFEADQECRFYVGGGLSIPDGTTTSYKWYDQDCFCDLDKFDPNEPSDETEEPTQDACTGTPLDPLPAATVCGKTGYIPENYLGASRTETPGTLAECYFACKAWSDCDVFEFIENSMCNLYPVQSSISPTAVVFTGSIVQWWQPSCFCHDTEIDPRT